MQWSSAYPTTGRIDYKIISTKAFYVNHPDNTDSKIQDTHIST